MQNTSGLQMTTLNDILDMRNHAKYATDTGTKMHKKLQHVVIDDGVEQGDATLISQIKNNPEILRFFNRAAKTEVPLAGVVSGKFVSRRIDRLCIDDKHKHIDIIDYKTDVNRDTFYALYVAQVREYVMLLGMIYPEYKIDAYILWTHDFSLEKIGLK